jgi:Zn finger protein HypA/HybF involved in hydrogenase expression
MEELNTVEIHRGFMESRQSFDRYSVATFECMECGYRMEAAHHPMKCPKCGSEMLNISNPRE